ncbi:hypothetical protein SCA6_020196 [Theobroma cacao]
MGSKLGPRSGAGGPSLKALVFISSIQRSATPMPEETLMAKKIKLIKQKMQTTSPPQLDLKQNHMVNFKVR